MFAILVLEREPFKWADRWSAAESWVQDAGGFAAAALVVWILAYMMRRPAKPSRGWSLPALMFVFAVIGTVLAYGVLGITKIPDWFSGGGQALRGATWLRALQDRCLTYGGICALVAVAIPFVSGLTRVRWRRVWALTRLSFKEAVRRRVLWAFTGFLVVLLFGTWFLPVNKPEDQLRNYVKAVYWAMTPLMLITAGLLAAFSIPSDLRNQTMHTIVTKPVERFEIVLGRFLGYTLLMTAVLAFMSVVSLVYVARGVDPDAKAESFKARVPIWGQLKVNNPTNVGEEWEYRSYISADSKRDWARWTFTDLPADLAGREGGTVPCEFSFAIYRTTKGTPGEEGRGVYCSLLFGNWEAWTPDDPTGVSRAQLEKYRKAREAIKNTANPPKDEVINNQLAEEYGIFEVRSKDVLDQHTQTVQVPAGLFKSLPKWEAAKGKKPAPLQVVVRCESRTQYLGVAKSDLYLLDGDRGFVMNFFKGAAGLWYRIVLIIVLAVTCSTYLSGVISFLGAMFVYVAGIFTPFIKEVAEGKSYGGGPMENLIRLATNEHPATPLGKSPVTAVAGVADEVLRWGFRRFLNLVPDVDRYDYTNYVAQGFNVNVLGDGSLVLNGLLLAAYLLPWAVLAYYLMRSREIAS